MRVPRGEQEYVVEMDLTVHLRTGPWLVIPAMSPKEAMRRALEHVREVKLNWWAWQEQDPPAQAKIKKITFVKPPNSAHHRGEQSESAMSLD